VKEIVMRFVVSLAGLVLALVAVLPVAAQQGVSDTEIVLGCSNSFSGPLAFTGEQATRFGVDLYFKVVNDAGGINGRKVRTIYYDDGYKPQEAVANTRKLVEQDRIFAVIAPQGTPPVMATLEYLEENRVPLLFPFQGSPVIRGKKYVFSGMTLYDRQSRMMIDYLVGQRNFKSFGALYQDDDYGKDVFAGLKKGLASRVKIVEVESYDPTSADVRSQMAKLKASKANVLCLFAFGKFAVQAYYSLNSLGWHPKVFVNDVASAASLMKLSPGKVTEGSISIVFGKDPSSPQWKRDKGMKLYRSVMAKYYADGISNSYAAAGAGAAYTMVDVLKKAGRNLTREGLMRAATHLTERGNPFVLPGIVVRTSSRNHFPIAQVKLQRWHKGHWIIFGKLISAKP
jgi:branched-chain amino acid transport system substrate-binding protein